jgi:thiamine transport system substrate-binding protein
MRFLLSKTFANIIPTTNWMYPVIKTTLPKGFNKVKIPKKMLLMNSIDIEKHRKEYIKEWLNALER